VKSAFAGLVAVLLAATAPVPAARAGDTVVVASKIDTEGALLGNLIAEALRRDGIAIENKIQLGPTQILRRAILAGQIELYPEYTGNGAIFFSREADPVWHDAARGYAEVKALDRARNDLVWLAPASADNTWAIAVRRDLAVAQKLATLEDFAAYVGGGGRVRLAASAEFVESPGALPAFETAYGFHLARGQLLTLVGGDTSATIRAAAEGISGVNAAMAYGTDGALAALGLVVLADDKGAQTVYEPAPVIRGSVLARHPGIPGILDPIFRSLTLARLQRLNAKIAVDGDDPKTVATAYLDANGFAK
jgi:osmoprotectant transport system substrate-binding protein